jgi:hypothetical protein
MRYRDKVPETTAPVNTSFETPNPQILPPVKAAEKLGFPEAITCE